MCLKKLEQGGWGERQGDWGGVGNKDGHSYLNAPAHSSLSPGKAGDVKFCDCGLSRVMIACLRPVVSLCVCRSSLYLSD